MKVEMTGHARERAPKGLVGEPSFIWQMMGRGCRSASLADAAAQASRLPATPADRTTALLHRELAETPAKRAAGTLKQ